jgi:hypothetical protein
MFVAFFRWLSMSITVKEKENRAVSEKQNEEKGF